MKPVRNRDFNNSGLVIVEKWVKGRKPGIISADEEVKTSNEKDNASAIRINPIITV